MIIKKISIGNQAIVRREVIFPSGKVILLRQGQTYITSDTGELEFLRTLKGLQMQDVGDKELRVFISKLPDVPTVDKDITKEEAKKYLWHDEDEDYVLQVLKEKGYIKDTVGADPEDIRLAKLKLRFGKITDSDIAGEIKRRSELGDLSDELKLMITNSSEENNVLNQVSDTCSENPVELSEEIILTEMKKLGYTGWRKAKVKEAIKDAIAET